MTIKSLEVGLTSNRECVGSAKITHKTGFTVMIVKDHNNKEVYGHSQVSNPFNKEICLATSTILENYIKKNGKEKSL